MDKIKVNSYDEIQKLETVLVGSTYDSSFFDGVKNKKIGDVLKKVCDETNEDIEYFKEQLKKHNVEVLHASPKELGYKDSILDYVDVNGKLGYVDGEKIVKGNLIPTPPLHVRDDSIVMGNKLLVTDNTFEVRGLVEKFKEWFGEDQLDLRVFNRQFKFRQPIRPENKFETGDPNLDFINNVRSDIAQLYHDDDMMLSGFCSPNLTRIGKSCIVDLWQTPDALDFMKKEFPLFDYKSLEIGGHLDSIFSILKPGLIIAGPWFKGNEHLFPGWKIIYFKDSNWGHVAEWMKLREKNRGAWWVPGEETNDQFTEFTESFLPNWTGYCEETIFDLNCLVIDDKHVVINSDNPELIKLLDENNITPIVCPLRNRFFWDGGWHCLTLDIRRSGGQVDYGL
jgi:hypothetical protein